MRIIFEDWSNSSFGPKGPEDPNNSNDNPNGIHCPKCGSTNVKRDVEGDVIGVISWILPGAPSVPGINYVCNRCRNRFMYVK